MNIFKNKKPLLIGARGEKAAVNYLKKCGYRILETNFFNPSGRRLGEIDIIAKIGEEFIFIEVKTRTNCHEKTPLPEENITVAKLHKLNKIASFYMAKNHLLDAPYRFDAISILADTENNCAKLKHLKNVFI